MTVRRYTCTHRCSYRKYFSLVNEMITSLNECFYRAMHYSAKRGLAIACRLSVCLSVCDTGGSRPHRLKILETNCAKISPTSSLFVAQSSSTYSQWNMEKFWGENVRLTPTSITSGWIESTESRVILGGGVAVCLFTFVSASRGHHCDSTAFLFFFSSVFERLSLARTSTSSWS